jgi:hypothetical protein
MIDFFNIAPPGFEPGSQGPEPYAVFFVCMLGRYNKGLFFREVKNASIYFLLFYF